MTVGDQTVHTIQKGPFAETQLGIVVAAKNEHDGDIIVKRLVPDGLAQRAGLIEGQRVLAINGTLMAMGNVADAGRLLKESTGEISILVEERTPLDGDGNPFVEDDHDNANHIVDEDEPLAQPLLTSSSSGRKGRTFREKLRVRFGMLC